MTVTFQSLAECMTLNPVVLDPKASLDQALQTLRNYGFRHIPVIEGNRLVGILSDRDLCLATSLQPAVKRLRDKQGRPVPGAERVEEIMRSPVHTLSPDHSPYKAAYDMVERHIGAIPVVDPQSQNQAPVGIVTESDLLRAYIEKCTLSEDCDGLAADRMLTGFPSVRPDTTVEDAMARVDPGSAHLLVVEEERLVGILSERDLLLGIAREMIQDAKSEAEGHWVDPTLPVSSVMSRDLVTVTPDRPLSACAHLMLDNRFSALPVVEGTNALGLLTQRQLLKHYSEQVS